MALKTREIMLNTNNLIQGHLLRGQKRRSLNAWSNVSRIRRTNLKKLESVVEVFSGSRLRVCFVQWRARARSCLMVKRTICNFATGVLRMSWLAWEHLIKKTGAKRQHDFRVIQCMIRLQRAISLSCSILRCRVLSLHPDRKRQQVRRESNTRSHRSFKVYLHVSKRVEEIFYQG